jgi:hypothetical protein
MDILGRNITLSSRKKLIQSAMFKPLDDDIVLLEHGMTPGGNIDPPGVMPCSSRTISSSRGLNIADWISFFLLDSARLSDGSFETFSTETENGKYFLRSIFVDLDPPLHICNEYRET